MKALSVTQQEIWNYIKEVTLDRGYPPTLREIGDRFQIASTNGVRYHLRMLVKKGFLERPKGMRRGLQLTLPEGGNPYRQEREQGNVMTLPTPQETGKGRLPGRAATVHPFPKKQKESWIDIPLLGRIAAGAPILAEENFEGTVGLDARIFHLSGQADLFGLRVQGDSMSGIGIIDGDIAVVHAQHEAAPGQIVAALVDGDATIKRLRPHGIDIWLEPENLSYRPIKVTAEQDFRIAGLVVGVIRDRVI